MGVQAELTFDSKEWKSYLDQLSERWNDPTARKKFIGILSSVFAKDYDDHFKKHEGPNGAWASWSVAYANHMRAIGKSGNNILIDTGRLRNSFTPSNVKTTKDAVIFYNPAQTKNQFPYAAAHDTGGPKLPKRKFMWLSNTAMSEITRQVGIWLAEG